MKRFVLLVLVMVIVANHGASWAEEYGNAPTYECTILYGGTTCRDVITAWGEDNDLSFDEAIDDVECNGCQPHTVADLQGVEHVLWFECENREARSLESESLDAHISKYRGASDEGFHVGSFGFSKCIAVYECYEYCSTETDPPQCIVSSGAWIGRWKPLIIGECGDPLEEYYYE